MEIYIISSGRPKRQITLENIPFNIRNRVKLVVPFNECAWYQKNLTGMYEGRILAPDIPQGLQYARQWCIDEYTREGEKKILMLDDDLSLFSRLVEEKRFVLVNNEELEIFFREIESKLDHYASVGVCTKKDGYVENLASSINTRLLRILAYRADILQDEGIRFDVPVLMEDIYVSLKLLTKGYPNIKLNYIVYNQQENNTKIINSRHTHLLGGCSQYRTLTMQKKSAKFLQKCFPEFVKIIETTQDDKLHINIRVQWKRAFNSYKGEPRNV